MTNEAPQEHAGPSGPKQGAEPTRHLHRDPPTPRPGQPPSKAGRTEDGVATWELTGAPADGAIDLVVRGRLEGTVGDAASREALEAAMEHENWCVTRLVDLRYLEGMDESCLERLTNRVVNWLDWRLIAILLPLESELANQLQRSFGAQREISVYRSDVFESLVLAFPRQATSLPDEAR